MRLRVHTESVRIDLVGKLAKRKTKKPVDPPVELPIDVSEPWEWSMRQADLYIELGETKEEALKRAAFLVRTLILKTNKKEPK